MTNEHITNAIESANELNGTLLTIAIERNETELYQTIVKRENEYVVWGYNAHMNGFYNGYYTNDIESAQTEFMRRMNR